MTATPTLADLCDLVSQQVDPTSVDAKLAYLGLEHLAPGRLEPVGFGSATDVTSNKFQFRRGDVLYGKLRPYLDKAVLADREGLSTTELLVLRPKEGVVPEYLACIVHAPDFIEHAMAGVTGAHHPRTSWSHIATFPVPRLHETQQRSLVRLLWSIHRAIQECEVSEVAATELKQASMHEMLTRGTRGEQQKETEIGPVPERWEIRRLGDDHDIAGGGTPRRSVPEYWEGGTIPWVKTAEVNYSVIRRTSEHITQAGLDNSSAKLLPPGTLLIAMFGQGVTRGRVGVLGIEASCNQACAALRPRNDRVEGRYLYHILTRMYEDLRQLAHGGQQQNLNIELIRGFQIPVPPTHDEQVDIARTLDLLDQKIDLHRQKRKLLEDLFKTLLGKLIAGEINVDQLALSALPTPEEALA